MSKFKHSVLILIALSLAALSASCGGGAPLAPEAPAGQAASSTVNSQPSQLPLPDGESSSGIAWDGTLVSTEDSPVLYRSASDWFDSIDWGGFGDLDWPAIWNAMHQPLADGDNSLDVRAGISRSSNATDDGIFNGFLPGPLGELYPDYVYGVLLTSAPGQMSYITYGLRDVPAFEDVLSVSVDAYGGFLGDDNQHGLYIGVSDYYNGRWQWYGPFKADALQDINIVRTPMFNTDGYGYITLACSEGDSYGIRGVSVKVGSPL